MKWHLRPIDKETIIRFISKADILISLQKKSLLAYDLEHRYKEGTLSGEDIHHQIRELLDDDVQEKYPYIYKMFLQDMDEKRSEFSLEFSYDELTDFFAEVKNMALLQEKFTALEVFLMKNDPM